MRRPLHMMAWLALVAVWVVSGKLTTVAAEAVHAARSVHLRYEGNDSDMFYNELAVEQSVNGSYFMACGWSGGYFGIQQQDSPTNKVVLFSVWDESRGYNPDQVPLEQRVEVLHEGEGTSVKRFRSEGTGGQCFWPYAWETNEVCRFAVASMVQGEKTAYAGWFFDNRAKTWRHLVTFRTRTGGRSLRGMYSFVEDSRRDGKSVQEVRRANFGNGWLRNTEGMWTPITRAWFTASNAEWEAKLNINAGTNGGRFYLATGGDTVRSRNLQTWMELQRASSTPPDDLFEVLRPANPGRPSK